MAALVVCLVLFLAMTGRSSATYCVCKDGLSESIYQKDIDYACGAGADCSAISSSGACYNPNTVKDHCNYAVNSYFQRKGQASGSCDFSGSATPTQSVPNQSSGCSYPSTATSGGTTPTTPTTPSTGTTPPTGTTPTGSTTPSTGTGTTPSTGTGTGTGTTTPTGTTTGTPSVFGLGPTGSGITNTDSSASLPLLQKSATTATMLFFSFALALLFSSFIMS